MQSVMDETNSPQFENEKMNHRDYQAVEIIR